MAFSLLVSPSFVVGMKPRIQFVFAPSRERRLDSSGRNSVFFRQGMGENGRGSSMKKIQNPIVHMLQPDPKFVNPVAKKIGFRPPELVSKFCQSLNPDSALVLRFG
jgi:hypothetical protein